MIDVSPEIRGLIFDCDGTLADSMPLHLEAWKRALSDFGETYRPEFFAPLGGMHEEQIVALYNRRYHLDLDPEELVRRKHVYFKAGIPRVEPIEPVVEVARRYDGELPMAVVSGGTAENVALTLEGLGIRRLFSVILTADDPIAPKPAPDLFLEAACRINVAPSLCQVFEDGDLGLEAARRAGMTATDVREFL